MNERIGSLSAELAVTDDDSVNAELIRLINENVKPLQAVGAEDVCIRSMYIVSDQVNSYGGRFPSDEHDRLAALLVDSPVMVGHRKDSLPIGRNFHATTVLREGLPWVRSYFYWLNSAEGAETLRDNIDKGVYKECSIGFTYLLPECSVCGEDIRRCRHNLFQSYADDGEDQTCHFNYRQIQRVLETSLVFRGATPDTSISKDLASNAGIPCRSEPRAAELPIITQISLLKPEATYLVVPHYEGVRVSAVGHGSSVRVCHEDGHLLQVAGLATRGSIKLPESELSGKLVGYRGRERCSVNQVNAFTSGGKTVVTRLVLYLYPDDRLQFETAPSGQSSVKLFRHRFVSGRQLSEVACEMGTKSGVEIWQVSSDGALTDGVRFLPPKELLSTSPESFALNLSEDSTFAELRINHKQNHECFAIHNLNLNRLQHGARFLAERSNRGSQLSPRLALSGKPICRTESGGWRLNIDALEPRELRLQPVRLHGRSRYLAYIAAGTE